MSSLSWLDFSENDRQRALDVLDLFRERGTVDELGIGTVRDALADVLFPGTSTIMTRARYYFFIPWLYQDLERRKTSSSEILQKGRRAEIGLIEALFDAGEREGLIGVEARKDLKRLPSTIYWQGLGVLGIRRFPGSRDAYHRSLDRFYRHRDDLPRGDDGHAVVGGRTLNWDPALPQASEGFPRTVSFSLTSDEAEYFRDKVLGAAPGSYFAQLVMNVENFEDADLPWDEPTAEHLPLATASDLLHARNFSDAMLGAALTYNLMLAEKADRDEAREDYAMRISGWADNVQLRMQALEDWNRREFWTTVDRAGRRVSEKSRTFIETWLGALIGGDPAVLVYDRAMRERIRLREKQLKRDLARLDGGRALERWGGASSAEPLDYRWSRPTRTLLRDLKSALGQT